MKLANYSTTEILAELEARKAVPTKIKFAFFLNNSFTLGEIQETIEDQTGYLINDELARKVSNHFYEVRFDCELNTETGEMYSE
jgi:hypothetical protein